MALLGFKKRFADKIRNGSKRQTIRALRKYPIRNGETLYLYTGLRTKYTEKLREVICKGVHSITIVFNSAFNKILVDGVEMNSLDALNDFAKRDGFRDWFDMREFWRENHPGKYYFKGILIKW